MSHLETRRPESSLFLSQRQRTQPTIPAPRNHSRTLERFGQNEFTEISFFPLMAARTSELARPFGNAIRISRAAQRGVIADQTARIEFVKTGLHQHHAVAGAGLNAVLQHMEVILTDQIAHGAVGRSEERRVGKECRSRWWSS